jgi:uracil-DNA glycosylase family 4
MRPQADENSGRWRRGTPPRTSVSENQLDNEGASPGRAEALAELNAEVVECRRCPRLVAWREQVAREKAPRYSRDEYWGRPLPGFGDPDARVLGVGLAPAAHGGNRTGRIFTGDRSGDFLFASLYRTGFANKPISVAAGDGLELHGMYVAAGVRCAPPGNRPTPGERDNCLPYLERELRILSDARTVVALGSFAWDGVLRALAALGFAVAPRPAFGHGAEAAVGDYRLIGAYHPSQQNTFTRKLTERMLDDVFERARALALADVESPDRKSAPQGRLS